ncbi:hypothetical protein GIB67_037791 [Kingdonia uniflora]|uniref:Uncharacterized protein n=1 Tax=Kingdonia uniflora TaxID=39325 RepID=A0A7J7LUZ6_9MAGN|nr:hypothetical protein GIB67_037791 [Kingdonia uniflora]
MEYPHHHNRPNNNNRSEEDEEDYRKRFGYPSQPTSHHHQPPPPFYREEEQFESPHQHYRPPQQQDDPFYNNTNRFEQPPNPPYQQDMYGGGPPQQPHYAPPPPPAVQHVSHVSNNEVGGYGYDQPEPEPEPARHHHLPSFVHHHTSHGESGSGLNGRPTVRVYSKAETGYSLTIRDGQVILVRSDPNDPFQHWIKDEKYSIRVKDEERFPSFSLVNKATGQALKHSAAATQPLVLFERYLEVSEDPKTKGNQVRI